MHQHRRKNIERKTPLRRSIKPLKSVALKLSSKPLPKRSKKKLAALGDEIEFARVVHARRVCRAWWQVPTDQAWRLTTICGSGAVHEGSHAHHLLPRSRGGTHDPEGNGMLLCARAHEWAHSHPVMAKRFGMLR